MSVTLPVSLFVPGRRVKSSGDMANSPKTGTVVSIEGNNFRVVWDDGEQTRVGVYAFTGARAWSVLPAVLEPELVGGLIAKAERLIAEKNEAKAREATAIEAACAALIQANPLLTQAPGSWCVKTAAKNLRAELKAAKIKASVRLSRFAGGNSIHVAIADEARYEEAEAIANKYKGSTFDSMQDLKSYIETVWTRCFGSTDYVSVAVERGH